MGYQLAEVSSRVNELESRINALEKALEADAAPNKRVKNSGQYENLKVTVMGVLIQCEKLQPGGDALGLGDWNITIGELTRQVSQAQGFEVTSQRIGFVCRKILGLPCARRRDGYHVHWNRGDLDMIGRNVKRS
jgi:hypothetical protein